MSVILCRKQLLYARLDVEYGNDFMFANGE